MLLIGLPGAWQKKRNNKMVRRFEFDWVSDNKVWKWIFNNIYIYIWGEKRKRKKGLKKHSYFCNGLKLSRSSHQQWLLLLKVHSSSFDKNHRYIHIYVYLNIIIWYIYIYIYNEWNDKAINSPLLWQECNVVGDICMSNWYQIYKSKAKWEK